MEKKERKIPGLAVDIGVLSEDKKSMLLIKRGHMPFKGKFAFPGGFVDYGEDPKYDLRRKIFKVSVELD